MTNKALFLGGRKGMSDFTWKFMFFNIPVALGVAIAMAILVKTYITTDIDIQEMHADLFAYNLLNEKDGLSYYDSSLDRVYPGIIAVSAFQDTATLEKKLVQRMNYGDHILIAAELQLFTSEDELLGTAYYNKEWFNRWIVLARIFWEGAGSTTAYAQNKTVLLRYDDGTMKPGILQLIVVMPNS
jgi:hypothetical protein